MRILILNWRDIKNPNSGGAEILTHEMAKRWVKLGHEVTQFSSFFKGSKVKETINGVKIIRKGNADARSLFHSVHFMAFLEYKKNFKGKFDVVIDEIHGLPFFTPFYIKEKKVALICEVAGQIWDVNFPFPFNIIGKTIEDNYFRFYRNYSFLTISNSTKKDLMKYGISKRNITVLPMGFNKPKQMPKIKKEKNLTLIFTARLVKAKGIEDAVEICNILKSDFPEIMLWIVGRGDVNYEKELKKKINDLKLKKNVKFWGYISQAKKFHLMARAHILLVPSIKEGFGLTIPEAGLVGTPSVAYNVEGTRDVIEHGKSGYLVKNLIEAARKSKDLFSDKKLYGKIQRAAVNSAKRFDWNRTAKVALLEIKQS